MFVVVFSWNSGHVQATVCKSFTWDGEVFIAYTMADKTCEIVRGYDDPAEPAGGKIEVFAEAVRIFFHDFPDTSK